MKWYKGGFLTHENILSFGVLTWKSNKEVYVQYIPPSGSDGAFKEWTVWMLWDTLFLDSFPTFTPLFLSELAVMKWLLSAHNYIEVPPFPFVPATLMLHPVEVSV